MSSGSAHSSTPRHASPQTPHMPPQSACTCSRHCWGLLSTSQPQFTQPNLTTLKHGQPALPRHPFHPASPAVLEHIAAQIDTTQPTHKHGHHPASRPPSCLKPDTTPPNPRHPSCTSLTTPSPPHLACVVKHSDGDAASALVVRLAHYPPDGEDGTDRGAVELRVAPDVNTKKKKRAGSTKCASACHMMHRRRQRNFSGYPSLRPIDLICSAFVSFCSPDEHVALLEVK